MSANQTNRGTGETAKILLVDVESSPNIGYSWGRYEQTIIEFVKERQIISFAWKWLGERKVNCLTLADFKGYKRNRDSNKALILELHRIVSMANIVVGHNVSAFDEKMSNSDFIVNGLTPPPAHKQVDTLKVARSKFKFNSNRLGDLGERLGLGKKVRTGGFNLWKGCLDGDAKSWAQMVRYNKGDVILLEKIYLKMRPWMTNHPAIKPRENTNRNPPCPMCHERKIQHKGYGVNRNGRYPRYQCGACGFCPSAVFTRREWRIK